MPLTAINSADTLVQPLYFYKESCNGYNYIEALELGVIVSCMMGTKMQLHGWY